jgi:hypothetical protein
MLQLLPPGKGCGNWRVIELKESIPVEAHHRQDSTKLDDERESMHERIALLNA